MCVCTCMHVGVHMCGGVLVYMHMWKPEVPRLMSRITLNGSSTSFAKASSFNQDQGSQRQPACSGVHLSLPFQAGITGILCDLGI